MVRAVLCRAFGGPEDLELADIPSPEMAPRTGPLIRKDCRLPVCQMNQFSCQYLDHGVNRRAIPRSAS